RHAMLRGRYQRRVRVDIDEAAIDLAVGRSAVDRGNRLAEWPIIENRPVDERAHGGGEGGAQMARGAAFQELEPPRPGIVPLRRNPVHFDNARRRKSTGE